MKTKHDWYHGVPTEGSFDERERRQLKLFEILCRHFAYLERVVLGEVSFELATYAASDPSVFGLPPDEQGAELARRERDRLCLGADPVVGMKEMLDGMGIKVVSRLMPEGSSIDGGFLFRSDIGPCIMVNSSRSPADQALTMAHEYCHFLADFDPYLPRVCTNGTFSGEDTCEERAWSFALEFLLPGDSLGSLLGRKKGGGVSRSELEALAVYFGVTQAAVAEQVGRMGLRAPEAAEAPGERGRGRSAEGAAGLPERFVRLAVEARSRGFISNLRAARLLQVAPAVASELVMFFSVGEAIPDK